MLKIVFNEKRYDYGDIGKKHFDTHAEINIAEEGTLTDAFQAFITTLKIAGYQVNREQITKAVEEAMDEIEY